MPRDDAAHRDLTESFGPPRSTMVHLRHRQPAVTTAVHGTLADPRIVIALRTGSLRLAPHIHNAAADTNRALDVLAKT
jgi:hypothetical protein